MQKEKKPQVMDKNGTIQRKKMSTIEKAFYLVWAIYEGAYTLLSASELSYMYDLSNIRGIINNVIILCLLLLFFMLHRFSKTEFTKYTAFIIVIALIEFSITDKNFFVYTLFMIIAQRIDFNKFIEFDMKLKLTLFWLIVFFCQIGFIDNYTVIINNIYKQSFGFSHPNIFTCYAYTLLLEWMYIRFEKAKIWEWIAQAVCGLIIFSIGGGRSSGYTFFLIYILFGIAKIKPQIFAAKPVYFMFTIITPLMAAFSFAGAWLYSKGNAYLIMLDQIFTGRFSSSARFISTYGITMFGREIESIGSRRAQMEGIRAQILDCAYVRCLLLYGLVFFILFRAYP